MDKSQHPQVIRPWKTRQIQLSKWNAPPKAETQRERRSRSPHSKRG